MFPDASVTNTSTTFSPKFEQSKVKFNGSATPQTPEKVYTPSPPASTLHVAPPSPDVAQPFPLLDAVVFSQPNTPASEAAPTVPIQYVPAANSTGVIS